MGAPIARIAFCVIGFVCGALLTAFGCYASLFFGWLTATPLPPAQRSRAEYNHYVWLAASLLGLALCIVSVVAARRRK